jgi:transglutaminase-like putative cysteine protease
LTSILFFFIPRFGGEDYATGGGPADRLVGFSPQLSLGEIGRTLESREVVMRAQFTNTDGTPFNVLIDPYFRGNVLSKYIPRQGIWMDAGESFYARTSALGPPPPDREVTIQTVVLEIPEPLFSVFPVFATGQNESRGLREDRHRMLLMYDEDEGHHGQRKYSIATISFRNGIQRRLTPASRATRIPGRMRPLLEFREQNFPALAARAKQLVEDSEIAEGDHQAIAKLLESHFKATGGYSYTLNQTSKPPRGVDPIEHFVSVTRSGHCEYFASALAMMLRSLDIPTRVVVGFHGGEYNRMGHFFLVRQLHAHAWVEAYITRQQLEEFSNFDEVATENGAWMRLDPTSGNGSHSVDVARGGMLKRFSQIGDFLEVLWKDYVVGLNSTRQREAIYRPIVERTSASLRGALLNPDWWVAFANELRRRLGLDSIESFQQRWVTWRSVPLLAAIFFAALFSHRTWKRLAPILLPWLAARLRLRRRSWIRDPQLTWFRRLERYLARKGHRRQLGQTHREFVVTSSQSLAGTKAGSELMETADQLIDGFYRVRFGNQRLGATELQQLEHAVRQLEAATR